MYSVGWPHCTSHSTAYSTFLQVGVVTDDSETDDKANRGFNLLYSQQPCLSAGWT